MFINDIIAWLKITLKKNFTYTSNTAWPENRQLQNPSLTMIFTIANRQFSRFSNIFVYCFARYSILSWFFGNLSSIFYTTAFSKKYTDYEPHNELKPPQIHKKQHPKHCIEEEVEWSCRSIWPTITASGVEYFNWVEVQTAIQPETQSFK